MMDNFNRKERKERGGFIFVFLCALCGLFILNLVLQHGFRHGQVQGVVT